ncbi:MAG: CPBP family intramembrane metalloprotease [Spirochaetales bacterium]|nr:CPBP family intramembrane metalloprotease [Spirochaetales bacterium]
MSRISNRSVLIPLITTAAISAMYVTGLPLSLFQYEVAGNNIFYLINIIVASAACLAIMKAFLPRWTFGFSLIEGLAGLKKYGWTGLIGIILISVTSYLKFGPLSEAPDPGVIHIWVTLYYFLVAFIEELFVRGVLQQTLITIMNYRKKGIFMAIITSSVIFGLGHIPGMLQYEASLIVMKLLWTIFLGIYLGTMYYLSGSLWTVIIIHWALDLAAGIFFYYSDSGDMFANSTGSLAACGILAITGLVIFYYSAPDVETS